MALQQPPPLQQAADEVAVAEPASSKVTIRIDRYFIEAPVEFPLTSRTKAREPARLRQRVAWRRNRRPQGATFGRLRKFEIRLFALGTFRNQRRRLHNGDARTARRATLLVLLRLRRAFSATVILICNLLLCATIALRRRHHFCLHREQRNGERHAQNRANDASNQHLHLFVLSNTGGVRQLQSR